MAAAVVFNLDHNAVGVGRSKDAIEKSSDGGVADGGLGEFSFPSLCNANTNPFVAHPFSRRLQYLSVGERSSESNHCVIDTHCEVSMFQPTWPRPAQFDVISTGRH